MRSCSHSCRDDPSLEVTARRSMTICRSSKDISNLCLITSLNSTENYHGAYRVTFRFIDCVQGRVIHFDRLLLLSPETLTLCLLSSLIFWGTRFRSWSAGPYGAALRVRKSLIVVFLANRGQSVLFLPQVILFELHLCPAPRLYETPTIQSHKYGILLQAAHSSEEQWWTSIKMTS